MEKERKLHGQHTSVLPTHTPLPYLVSKCISLHKNAHLFSINYKKKKKLKITVDCIIRL